MKHPYGICSHNIGISPIGDEQVVSTTEAVTWRCSVWIGVPGKLEAKRIISLCVLDPTVALLLAKTDPENDSFKSEKIQRTTKDIPTCGSGCWDDILRCNCSFGIGQRCRLDTWSIREVGSTRFHRVFGSLCIWISWMPLRWRYESRTFLEWNPVHRRPCTNADPWGYHTLKGQWLHFQTWK